MPVTVVMMIKIKQIKPEKNHLLEKILLLIHQQIKQLHNQLILLADLAELTDYEAV
jgi:hypothetical protein